MNDHKENRLIILGLLVIALVIVIGYFALSSKDRTVADGVLLMASGIVGGLIGYLTRGNGKPSSPTLAVEEDGRND